MGNTAEQTKISLLLRSAREWTPQSIHDHAVSAQDTITNLADVLEKLIQGEVVTQYRVTYRYGVNESMQHTGYSVDSIVARVERDTMGPVGVTKIETRVVITTPWEEDK